jgi:hypothetical protein
MPKVSELINPITCSWDEELVGQTFVEQDVEIILATPVHTELADLVAWHYDSKGMFSVKSAYKVYREHLQHSSRNGVATSADGGNWQRNNGGKSRASSTWGRSDSSSGGSHITVW